MKRTYIFLAVVYFIHAGAAQAMGVSPVAAESASVTALLAVHDSRVEKLKQYLGHYGSPLAPFARVFVENADRYGLPDWRLVPAITGVESTFGTQIPKGSYNAYGWANGTRSFSGWENSIDLVSRTLKNNYYDKDLTTVEQIAQVYAPPSKTWAGHVRFFLNDIDQFSFTGNGLPLTL